MSVRVDSVKAPELNGKLSKLYLDFRSSTASNHFVSSLAVKLKTELHMHGVDSDVHIDFDEPVTLDSEYETLVRKISSGSTYHADGILMLQQNETGTYRTVPVASTLTASLYLATDPKHPVWKAVIKITNASALSNLAQTSTDHLIKRLQRDQIIL